MGVDSRRCATRGRVSRSFDATCAHLSDHAVREEVEQLLRVNEELTADVESLLCQVEDLMDELRSTRAGHPR